MNEICFEFATGPIFTNIIFISFKCINVALDDDYFSKKRLLAMVFQKYIEYASDFSYNVNKRKAKGFK